MYAACYGHEEVVHELFRAGANMNVQDKVSDGLTC